ncbi:hypothetical protein S40285_07348 [Stachybotrys chlorohalonatus IBT 40285]|uniref:Ketoreductase (KR) domain-containing protein n=1 Tax=Stachybotrys chlorohalonatus (strain IBT 40285) TaxID=1283841 RepID=A0A084Q9L6_STAC4|nr:hypothetical protein S40285_07348 [Stachybotrys chlorohalonata IBT 40285]
MAASKGSILLTGANGGLGSATVAKILKSPELESNYVGLYTVRKAASATQLKSTLANSSIHRHEILELDLGSLASVRKLAADVNARVAKGDLPRIRALILNAGYQEHTTLTMSEDGFEMSWQVNYLANKLLTLLLLESMDPENGRILLIGSWSHDIDDIRNTSGGNVPYQDPRWQDLFPEPETLAKGRWSTPQDDPHWYAGYRRYGASKLCEVMFTHELGHRIARDPKLCNISVIGLDPGGMASDLGRRGSTYFRFMMKYVIPVVAPVLVWMKPNGELRTTAKSASDIIRACFDIDPPKGKPLYLNGSEEWTAAKETRDQAKMKALWDYGISAAAITEGDTNLANWR